MVNRSIKLSDNSDLFVFGARGTGKSTLIEDQFGHKNTLWINLLKEDDERRFGKDPDELSKCLKLNSYDYVVIDEVQKFPKLLDIVHLEIESKKSKRPYFILSGSSARKLKRSGANLLAGRAFTNLLFPLTYFELKGNFNLNQVLQYGTLPFLFNLKNNETDKIKKEEYLRSYVSNYLKEEILIEQLVRKIEPFKDFLEIAAQMNGEIINYSKISKEIGISDQTVKTFFEILSDTLVGFILPSFNRSIRKQQRESPKFYFFDLGVKRALDRTLTIPIINRPSEYGKAFEHFIILEIVRMSAYSKNDFKLSYLRTKENNEIDLVIERPGQSDFLIEIKSTDLVTDQDVKSIALISQDWDKKFEAQVWSQDPNKKLIRGITCLPWQDGLKQLFSIK